MTVNPVAGVAAAATIPAATTGTSSTTLDKDAFLQLLVASLKYQDPSAPMSTTELMNQTTQLATMEQLTEMTQLSQESFALQVRSSATNLVGQHVTYLGEDGTVTGPVESVDLTGEVPAVVVDGVTVPLGAITAVVTPPATA